MRTPLAAPAPQSESTSRPRGAHGVPVAALAWGSVGLLALVSIDVFANAYSFFDRRVLRAVQRFDPPGLEQLFRVTDVLTGLEGALLVWAALLALALVARWWLPAMALLVLPVIGLLNEGINALSGRGQPALDEVARTGGGADAIIHPSGQVGGAVLLYGVLFVVADHLHNTLLRRLVKTACVAVIVLVGVSQVWRGERWPSDVIAAYALGGLVLAGLLVLYRRIDRVIGTVPFVHAAIPPHDESVPHAHALTSLVLFDGPTVEKIYGPGFVPRIIYWLAFQAEFPYIRNQAALQAALYRRNLAALLTEYWYGSPRVARIVSIDRAGDGYGVRSEYVDGHAPRDREAARQYLADLCRRFEEAGYPTWQIDPRQPRAVDNIMETADGAYMVVDLESGLVSPLASLKSWGRAFRRGLVPIFDDVYFDLTRAYVAREEAAMRARLGDAWTDTLLLMLARAEATTGAWRRSEPRIWSHLVYNIGHGFGIRHWPAHLRAEVAGGRERARDWTVRAIAAWEREGRLTLEEAARVRAATETPEFQALLPHLGAHLALSLVLRFPFGGIARLSWTLAAIVRATAARLSGRLDDAAWRQARNLHTPLVQLLCPLPSFGALAYLAAPAGRRNHLLLRVLLDAALLRLPLRLYERTGLRHLIARPAARVAGGDAPRPI